MALYLVNHYINNSNIVDDFKSFLIHDGILSVAGGIVIGITTAAFIKTLVVDMLLPIIYICVFRWIRYFAPLLEKNVSSLFGFSDFKCIHFLQELFVWIIAIISTFLVLEFFVRRTLFKDRHNVIAEDTLTKAEVKSAMSSTLPSLRPDPNVLQSFSNIFPPSPIYI